MKTTTSKSIRRLAPVAALVLGTLAGTALAADPMQRSAQGQRMLTVSYADLNLASNAGLDTLRSRISRAARAVCGYPADARELGRNSDARSCYENAVDTALQQIGTGTLAAN